MGRLIVIVALAWLAVVNGVAAKGFMHGFGGDPGAPVTPCGTPGALNLSVSGANGGCNIPQFYMGVFGWSM